MRRQRVKRCCKAGDGTDTDDRLFCRLLARNSVDQVDARSGSVRVKNRVALPRASGIAYAESLPRRRSFLRLEKTTAVLLSSMRLADSGGYCIKAQIKAIATL